MSGRPVVLLHGFASGPEIWRGSELSLAEAGLSPVLISWAPGPSQSAQEVATEVLLPAVEKELSRLGHPPGTSFDIVAHSMAGLLVRYLLEQGQPTLQERVGRLVMISTPNQGARTGVAAIGCGTWSDPGWREMACALRPGSDLLEALGPARPPGTRTEYLAIGVESLEPMVPIPPYDGDGDGVPRGHDKAVMAESVRLEGAPFVVWQGWGRMGDHFGVTCAATVNRWAIDFILGGLPPTPAPGRLRSANLCEGLNKRLWLEKHSEKGRQAP